MEYLFTPMFLEAQLMAVFSGFPKTLTHTCRHHRLSSISLLAVYILWLFWLLAGVFYPACKPLRMTDWKKRRNPKTKTTSWNCNRELYIALFLCYRVNLRNLWQEVGQISCLCAVSGNKQNGNEVKRKENKHIHKQNATVLKSNNTVKKNVFLQIYTLYLLICTCRKINNYKKHCFRNS